MKASRNVATRPFSISRGFTLIELLVVVAIIALLLSILLPSLGRARETVRTTHCASGMRQWGVALQYYLNDYAQCMPLEGSTSAPSGANPNFLDDGNWFNALPDYVNAPRYYLLYPGYTARIGTTMTDSNGTIWTIGNQGTAGGYKNAWIWYCQSQLLINKNSTSGLNSFHYTMNALLDGAGSSATWGGDLGQMYVKTSSMTDPASTVFLFESTGNNPNDTPSSSTSPSSSINIDVKRHRNAVNINFVDGHQETITGQPMTVPTRADNNSAWNSSIPRLMWGPFFGPKRPGT